MSSFRLQSGDSGFNSRVDALFSSLQTVAVDLETQPRLTPEEDSEGNEDIAGGDRDRDVFRKPLEIAVGWRGRGGGRGGRAPRNTTPDYVQNPQKWTRYNMKDTKLLSDRENKQVGLKLFDELRTQRAQKDGNEEGECDVSDEGCSEAPKILFKKPTKSADADIVDDNTNDGGQPENLSDAYFGGAKKLRMQEYVVGKPSRKRSLKKNDSSSIEEATKESSNKQIKLGHLMFEDEEV